MKLEALIFDCDGVLVDTERDGHRVAFNQAFRAFGIKDRWSPEDYRELLRVAGGKERMEHYFNASSWPDGYPDREQLIADLHARKTKLFMQLIASGSLPLRSGVKRLVDEAIREGIQLAVCSTSNEKSVNLIVDTLLGKERKAHFKAILAGDVVSRKKPDPEIYHLCRATLRLNPLNCVVIEDSRNGLVAAKAAGFHCLVTTNPYTVTEDFPEADLVVPELGDGRQAHVDIDTLNQLLNS